MSPHACDSGEAFSCNVCSVGAGKAFRLEIIDVGLAIRYLLMGDQLLVLVPLQSAKEGFGAKRVVATSGAGKLEKLKSLGVDFAINYTKHSFEDLSEKKKDEVMSHAIGTSLFELSIEKFIYAQQ